MEEVTLEGFNPVVDSLNEQEDSSIRMAEVIVESFPISKEDPLLTNWEETVSEISRNKRNNILNNDYSDILLVKWANMVNMDISDLAVQSLDSLEEDYGGFIQPYLNLADERTREVALTILWGLNITLFLLVWYIVAIFIQFILRSIFGRASKEEFYRKSASGLAESMRMLIDKQSKEMGSINMQKHQLEEQIATLEDELDRIVAVVENSSGNLSNINVSAITSSRAFSRMNAGAGTRASIGEGALPRSSLRRNRTLYRGGGSSDGAEVQDHSHRHRSGSSSSTLARGNSIASPSLANTIAANASLLGGTTGQQGSQVPQYQGIRGVLQRLVSAIPETDEHPVVGYMPSPTPRTTSTTTHK